MCSMYYLPLEAEDPLASLASLEDIRGACARACQRMSEIGARPRADRMLEQVAGGCSAAEQKKNGKEEEADY